MWIDVISANFEESGKNLPLRESFINLRRSCGNILSSLKIRKGMSTPNDFLSSNAKITSNTFLGVTGRNEKGLIVMYLPLIFFILGVVFVLIKNTF